MTDGDGQTLPVHSPVSFPLHEGNALEVERLTVRFGGTTVLDSLSFEVPRATSMAIIGPNGSGKTVLFKALVGALPHDGQVRWADGTRLGYVPQKLDIERDLPLACSDFLRAKAAVSGARPHETSEALRTVGFSGDLSRRPIGALSGGQFQRLLFAAALLGRPTVLLLDEPTAGVDEPGQEQLYETITRVRRDQGLTLLLISHELSVVYRYADTVLCLGHARPCQGVPDEILTADRLAALYGAPVKYHRHDADHQH